jgi:hypothetical protein
MYSRKPAECILVPPHPRYEAEVAKNQKSDLEGYLEAQRQIVLLQKRSLI